MPQIVAVVTEELSLQRWRAKLDRFYLYDLLTEPEHRIHIKMTMLVYVFFSLMPPHHFM